MHPFPAKAIAVVMISISLAHGQAAPVSPRNTTTTSVEDDTQATLHAEGIQGGIDEAKQEADDADKAIQPLLAKLTHDQNAAYERAATAMRKYIEAQVTGDVLHMGGYGSGGLYPDLEHAAFENLVIACVAKHPSAATGTALAAADASLNEAYRTLQNAAAQVAPLPRQNLDYGSITPASLRTEERLWLAWRDAFAAFGHTLDPALPPSAWLLPITAARAADLRTVYEYAGTAWLAEAQKHAAWAARVTSSSAAETENGEARVAEFFDHQTPVQAAAWNDVQKALDGFVRAHNEAVPHASLTFRDLQLKGMYGELYARKYNLQHGFAPAPHAQAEAARASNDKRLNEAYAEDLATPCLFQPSPGEAPTVHRTREGFRAEQRAWIALRDAWGSFEATLFPDDDLTTLTTMMTGSRAFFLGTLSHYCQQTGQPPREQ